MPLVPAGRQLLHSEESLLERVRAPYGAPRSLKGAISAEPWSRNCSAWPAPPGRETSAAQSPVARARGVRRASVRGGLWELSGKLVGEGSWTLDASPAGCPARLGPPDPPGCQALSFLGPAALSRLGTGSLRLRGTSHALCRTYLGAGPGLQPAAGGPPCCWRTRPAAAGLWVGLKVTQNPRGPCFEVQCFCEVSDSAYSAGRAQEGGERGTIEAGMGVGIAQESMRPACAAAQGLEPNLTDCEAAGGRKVLIRSSGARFDNCLPIELLVHDCIPSARRKACLGTQTLCIASKTTDTRWQPSRRSWPGACGPLLCGAGALALRPPKLPSGTPFD